MRRTKPPPPPAPPQKVLYLDPNKAPRVSPNGTRIGGQATPKKLMEHERTIECFNLRKKGYAFIEIAKILGYADASGPQKAVLSVLQSIQVDGGVEEYRQMEIERLNRMQLAVWDKVEEGDINAINTTIRLMERRARLLGLDLPVKHSVQGGMEVTGAVSFGDGAERQVRVYLPANGREQERTSHPPPSVVVTPKTIQ